MKEKIVDYIICECGYHNKPEYVKFTGICNGCKKVLDERAKFKNEMNKKMKLWKGKLRKW
jgi:hypothetical protein